MIIEGPKDYFLMLGSNQQGVEAIGPDFSEKFDTKVLLSFDKLAQTTKSIGAVGYVMDCQSERNNYNLQQLHQQFANKPRYIFTGQISIPLLHFALRLGFKDVFQLPLGANKLAQLAAELREITHIDCFDPQACQDNFIFSPDEALSHPLGDLFNLLERHFADGPSLQQMANKLFLSPSRISHLFKDLCGIGYSQYILCRRLEQSEHLLQQTDHDITSISYQLGFSNPSHFCRSFKEHIGITPTAYIKKEVNIELSQLYLRYQQLRMDFLPSQASQQDALQPCASVA